MAIRCLGMQSDGRQLPGDACKIKGQNTECWVIHIASVWPLYNTCQKRVCVILYKVFLQWIYFIKMWISYFVIFSHEIATLINDAFVPSSEFFERWFNELLFFVTNCEMNFFCRTEVEWCVYSEICKRSGVMGIGIQMLGLRKCMEHKIKWKIEM